MKRHDPEQLEFELDFDQASLKPGLQASHHHPQQGKPYLRIHEPELPLNVDSQYFPAWREARWDDCRGYQAPRDETTGLPIPVLPIGPLYPNTNNKFVDYHHLFHPKQDLIRGDDADIAIRRSFGQDLPRWLHEHYHGYFAGPSLPEIRSEKFVAVVLACAGFVPRQAIEFTMDGPIHRKSLTDEQYDRVRTTTRHEGQFKGEVGRFCRNQIGIFFANYALEQKIEDVVSESIIDEFLNTRRQERRIALGNLMMREGIVLSVEPIKPRQKEAKLKGLLPRTEKGLGSLICEYFVLRRRSDYLEALHARLTSQPQVA